MMAGMSNEYQPVVDSRITCVECGYDLSGSPVGGNCPECGTPVKNSLVPSRTASTGASTSGAAMVCMILGIVGIVGCQLTAPFAIGYYYKAKREIDSGLVDPGAITYAKTGLILGWFGVVLLLLQVTCMGFYYAMLVATA